MHALKARLQKLVEEMEKRAGDQTLHFFCLYDATVSLTRIFQRKIMACRVKPGKKGFVFPSQSGSCVIDFHESAGKGHARAKAHEKEDPNLLQGKRLAFNASDIGIPFGPGFPLQQRSENLGACGREKLSILHSRFEYGASHGIFLLFMILSQQGFGQNDR
jgi:hypothetical protein